MTRTYKGLIAGSFLAAIVYTTVAYAAGLWTTLPIIGGASFCASTVSGTSLPSTQGPYGLVPGSTQGTGSSICAQTVPAGPPSLTGAEKFPVDTGLAGGASPSSAVVTTCQIAGGSYAILSPNASTATIANQVCYYIIGGTTTYSTLTLTLPSTPIDGQQVRISSTQTVSTLTISGAAGQTVSNAPTSATAGGVAGFIYDAALATWFRI